MFCEILSIDDDNALIKANDLGIAMQLTNIARDRGWDNLFKWLHNLSVLNTILIMIIAIIQIFRITTL